MNQTIYNEAMKILSRRDHSRQELINKLQMKKYQLDDITPIIERLIIDNHLNETRFTESYIRWRRGRGFGPVKVALELKQRGISDDLIEQCIQANDDEWYSAAKNEKTKKFGEQTADNFEQKMAMTKFLQYRGFNADHIQAILG